MNKKEILIESAKYIAEHCGEHDECTSDCVFYTQSGDRVCLFHTAYMPCGWKFGTIKEN